MSEVDAVPQTAEEDKGAKVEIPPADTPAEQPGIPLLFLKLFQCFSC